MDYKTPEQIASETEHLAGLAERRAVNRLFRQQDESHKWPVCNQFNITNRAIRKVNQLERANGALAGLEYCEVLSHEIAVIVNGYI